MTELLKFPCYCCLGTNKHEKGPCNICTNGYLVDPSGSPDSADHESIIRGSNPCKLSHAEKEEALAFIQDGKDRIPLSA